MIGEIEMIKINGKNATPKELAVKILHVAAIGRLRDTKYSCNDHFINECDMTEDEIKIRRIKLTSISIGL